MSRRRGKVWTSHTGWVQTKQTAERDYSQYDDLQSWAFLIWVFRWFPDKLLDILRSDTAEYPNEELLQRVMMRAYARNDSVAITGTRGFTKTNTKMKYAMVNGIVWPGVKSSYFGPSYVQMAAIGAGTYRQIEKDYPGLAAHWKVTAESKDDFKIETDCGSSFYISAIRGDNLHDVTAEEYAQEELPPFDHKKFAEVVSKAVRLPYVVNGKVDENFIPYKHHYITSAGRKQNEAFQNRCRIVKDMTEGVPGSFAMDVPWQCIVLSQMRPYKWVEIQRRGTSIDAWMREMESHWTGADENPVLSDELLTDAQRLLVMETQHCCKERENKLAPEDVIYVIGYDLSYETGQRNAKCAAAVLKLTRQKDFYRRYHYMKQLVYLDDWPPPTRGEEQALKVKRLWDRFTFDTNCGGTTYIAVDAWQYGRHIVEDLMKDLGDGLPPLCIRNHEDYTEAELPGALPVIYPVKAGGAGAKDADYLMMQYAQTEFEHHNIELLTLNTNEGVDAYKKYHKIKDDDRDYQIARPYQKTRELSGQIQNLKLVPSGSVMSEKRISKAIQRDSWSALKYALRMAHILEREELLAEINEAQGNDWKELLEKYGNGYFARNGRGGRGGRLVTARRGGRIF